MGSDAALERRVEGVEYASSDLAPGLLMFSCDRLKATLSMGGCAARWLQAKSPTRKARRQSAEIGDDRVPEVDRFAACRGCALGAAHAGEAVVEYSGFFGASICPRCRNGTTRMIGGRICVSCYNREREQVVGRNARGNVPTKLVPLRSVQFRAMTDGRGRLIRAHRVVDLVEPVIQTLRTTPGVTVFAYAAPRVGIRQGDLFASMPAPRAPLARGMRAMLARAQRARRLQAADTRQGLLF